MIRTRIVYLTSIEAIAYRQKLAGGKSGVVVLRKGVNQPGIASISRTSGEAIPAVNTKKDFPLEAFNEAIALTAGLPYKNLKGVRYMDKPEETEDTSDALPEVVVVDSKDYNTIVEEYTDKEGKLSYSLINRSMMKFANSSSVVRNMIANKASVEEIRAYVVGMKFRNITNNRNLSNEQITKIVELLDEVSSKSVFKEFNEELRRKLKK